MSAYAETAISRDDAERAVLDAARGLGPPFEDVCVERVVAYDVGWAVFVGPATPPKVDEAWRNVQTALFPDAPPSEAAGLGAFLVTHDGAVFGTGSAHPLDVYVEDVRVLTRRTWNPFRIARFLVRRVFDGRTPFRVA